MNNYEGLGSIRKKPAPKKTGIGYKVFFSKNGKLYPPMVANPGGEDTPVGVWLDADAAPIVGKSKTGRPKVKAGGKGTQGGSGELAYRPGWHLGLIPYAIQFNRKDENGEKTLFPKDFVWAEVEYAADKNYQKEAEAEGITEKGEYRHSYAGLKKVPKDGYYIYRTNPNPETDPWIITGAMKVNRILSDKEVDDLVRKAGREPQRREGEGLGFASFHISKNEDEFFANVEEAIEKNGVVRDDVCNLDFPVLTLLPIKFNRKGNLLSLIKKIAEEKNIIGSHKVLVGDSIGIVNISNKFFKKALSEKAISKSDNKELQYVSSLNIIEILNNSLDVEIHPNVLKVNGDRILKDDRIDKHTLIHRLFSAILFDGDYYRTKITLKENHKQKNTIYTIENMKIELLSPSKGTPREHLVTSNSITSAILLNKVEKSHEKGVFLLECGEKRKLNGVNLARKQTKWIGELDDLAETQYRNRMKARMPDIDDYTLDEVAGKIYKENEYTNIRYTKNDFFQVDLDNLKRVHEFIMYMKEFFVKKTHWWLDILRLDADGYPIYIDFNGALMFIETYKQYKDQWKKDFFYGDSVDYFVKSQYVMSHGDNDFSSIIMKLNHKPSVQAICDFIEKTAKKNEFSEKFIKELKEHIKKMDSDAIINKMINAYKRAFSPAKPSVPVVSDLYKYLEKSKLQKYRKTYSGIYYDDGYAVTTDGHFIFAHKKFYDKKNEGKIIDEIGKEIDGKYPNWRYFLLNESDKLKKLDIDRDELYKQILMYDKAYRYRDHKAPIEYFSIKDGDKIYFYSAKLLKGFLHQSMAYTNVSFYVSVSTNKYNRLNNMLIMKSDEGSYGIVMQLGTDNYEEWLDEVNKYGMMRDFGAEGYPFILYSVYETGKHSKEKTKPNNIQLAKAKMKMAAARLKMMNMSLGEITYEMD